MDIQLIYRQNFNHLGFTYEPPKHCAQNSTYGFKFVINDNTEIEVKLGSWSGFALQYNPKFIPIYLLKPYTRPHGGIHCFHNFNLPGGDLFVAPYNTDLPYCDWAWLKSTSDQNCEVVQKWSTDIAASATSINNEWVDNKKCTGGEEAWDTAGDADAL